MNAKLVSREISKFLNNFDKNNQLRLKLKILQT